MNESKGRVEAFLNRSMPSLLRPYWEKLGGSSVGYRLAHGAFWSFVGAVASRGFTLLSSIVVARVLGKEGFGELGIVQSTVAMFQAFAGFGLGLTATKHVAEFKSADPARAGRIIALSSVIGISTGLVASVAMYFLSPLLAARMLSSPHLEILFRLSSVMLFFGAVNGAQTGALSGFEAFKNLSKVNFISGAATFTAMVGGVVLAGLNGAVYGLIISMGINCALNYYALRYEARRYGVPMRYHGCLGEWKGLWRFSLLATLSGIIVTPVTWASNAIVVNQPGGYGELGVFNAVTKIKQVPEMVVTTVLNPLLPMLSEQFGRKDHSAYGKTLTAAYLLSCLIMIPLSILAIYWPDLFLLPYGKSYAGYGTLVQWLFIHAIMVGLFSPLASVLASTNTMWLGFVYNLAYSIFLIAFAGYLVPTMLGTGLAISLCLASLIPSMACLWYINHSHRSFMGNFNLINLSVVFILFGVVSVTVYNSVGKIMAAALGILFSSLAFLFLVRLGSKINQPSRYP